MRLINLITILFTIANLSCTNDDNTITEQPQGNNLLLIGNSFFKPYAQKLDVLAEEAGLSNHNSTLITRGGDNGRPINFWNDSNSNEHQRIKAALDQGNIDFFGMTAGHNPENRTEGHSAWINYALQNNPNITIFIAIPQIDYPLEWEQRADEFGFDSIEELYESMVNDIVHKAMIDELRDEFPNTKIFTIPTGWSSLNLNQMLDNNTLLDEINFMGPKPNSLFVDQKGHQGQIIIETGALVWLNSIYNIDLRTNNYETGFRTDLHQIAIDIMDNHDENYKN